MPDRQDIAASAGAQARSWDGYERYPMSLRGYNCFMTNGESLSEKLSVLAGEIFCKSEDAIKVDIFDIDGPEPSKVSHLTLSRTKDLENQLVRGTKSLKVRIISIAQKHSLEPLDITEQAMRKILTYYQVMPNFLSFIFSCGNYPQGSDTGSRGLITNHQCDGVREVMYLYKYVEQHQRSQKNQWSIRQTVMYQQISKEGFHTWIILHPRVNSAFHTRLRNSLEQPEGLVALIDDPWNLHHLLISSYTDNWRWYLDDLGGTFLDTANLALTTDLEEDYQVGFKTVQSLRNLQDKTHNAFACLDASIRILTELSCIEKRVDELASSVSQLQGNINSIDSLRKRVQGIINHVSKIISISRGTTLKNAYATCIDQLTDTLNFKSQIIAQQSNKHMLGLTLETVDDSATVRVIGVVTLIYLPSTFVATILGMNLFKFTDKTPNLQVANDIWIFLVLAIPLTVLTVACWVSILWRKRKRKSVGRNVNVPSSMESDA